MTLLGGGLKKTLLSLLIIFYFSRVIVFAGDYPEAIITDPDVDVFLGEITEVSDDTISLSVSKALFSCYEIPNITLDSFMYMTGENNKTPKTGDYCAIAAKYENDNWLLVNGMAVKSDSIDEETLTLYSGGHNFAIRMNEYINNGDYSKENRQRLLNNLTNNTGEEGEIKQNESAAVAEENTSIADEDSSLITDVSKKPAGRPIYEYVLMTIFSMIGGYIASKIVQKRHNKKYNR